MLGVAEKFFPVPGSLCCLVSFGLCSTAAKGELGDHRSQPAALCGSNDQSCSCSASLQAECCPKHSQGPRFQSHSIHWELKCSGMLWIKGRCRGKNSSTFIPASCAVQSRAWNPEASFCSVDFLTLFGCFHSCSGLFIRHSGLVNSVSLEDFVDG